PPQLRGSGATESAELVRFKGTRRPRYQVVIQENLLSLRVGEALSDPGNTKVVSAADAISDLADLPVGNRSDELPYSELPEPRSAYQRLMRDGAGLANVQVPRMNRDTELRLEDIPQGGNHRDLQEKLLERYITGHRWGQDNGTGRLSRRHLYAYR